MDLILLPRDPTPTMLLAYRGAIRRHIDATPLNERNWPIGKRRGRNVYLIPECEKAAIRYRAMAAAFEAEQNGALSTKRSVL